MLTLIIVIVAVKVVLVAEIAVKGDWLRVFTLE